MREAVIVGLGRSAIGKAPKGSLKYTRPEDIMAQVVNGVLEKIPQINLKDIDDFILGCAMPEAEQGLNVAKIVAMRAGLPDEVPGQTVNRFCASGLQSIASAANAIMTGQAEMVIAGGLEFMSVVPMAGNTPAPNPWLIQNRPEAYISMGLTAENVADRYAITREQQDQFAVESNQKAARAIAEGKFREEIIPVDALKTYVDTSGGTRSETFIFDRDECVRPNTTLEGLAKLKPSFKNKGTVTAGNSSQLSDGAAAVLLMSKEKADELGLETLATFRSFAVAGVGPEVMGIGPIKAIPKALKIAGITKDELDLIELNEAFASQSIACIEELALDKNKINVNGGAIALGHPLGCTGAFLMVKLVSELKRRKGKYGLVSMCIGGGMGAAAVVEC